MAASLKMCLCKTAWHSCVVQLIVGCGSVELRAAAPERGLVPGVTCEHCQQIKIL